MIEKVILKSLPGERELKFGNWTISTVPSRYSKILDTAKR
jgi:hypothetical protein